MDNNKKKINLINIPESLAEKYINKKSKRYSEILYKKERKERLKHIKKVKRTTIFIAGLYGALGVLLLYLPQYIFPEIFNKT